MHRLLLLLLSLFITAAPDQHRADSEAAVLLAYASMAHAPPAPAPKPKPEPKPAPKPDPGDDPDKEIVKGCTCGDDCKCESCKCENCKCKDCDGKPKTVQAEKISKWEWFACGANAGEYRKIQGTEVLQTLRYEKRTFQSCQGRRCTLTTKWVLVP